MGRRKPWWERQGVENVRTQRNGDNALQVAFFPGDQEEDALLQIANVWQGNILRRQPLLRVEDVIVEPRILDLLKRFVSLCEDELA